MCATGPGTGHSNRQGRTPPRLVPSTFRHPISGGREGRSHPHLDSLGFLASHHLLCPTPPTRPLGFTTFSLPPHPVLYSHVQPDFVGKVYLPLPPLPFFNNTTLTLDIEYPTTLVRRTYTAPTILNKLGRLARQDASPHILAPAY